MLISIFKHISLFICAIVSMNILTCDSLYSQVNKINNCRLTFTYNTVLDSITLSTIRGDSLEYSKDSIYQWIKIDSLVELRFVHESKIWETAEQYATYSGITGVGVSAVIIAISAKGTYGGLFEVDNGTAKILGVIIGAPICGAFFGILGGVIGSIVGIIQGIDEVYDLSSMSLRQKVAKVYSVLNKIK